jgi:hypothetical protein
MGPMKRYIYTVFQEIMGCDTPVKNKAIFAWSQQSANEQAHYQTWKGYTWIMDMVLDEVPRQYLVTFKTIDTPGIKRQGIFLKFEDNRFHIRDNDVIRIIPKENITYYNINGGEIAPVGVGNKGDVYEESFENNRSLEEVVSDIKTVVTHMANAPVLTDDLSDLDKHPF